MEGKYIVNLEDFCQPIRLYHKFKNTNKMKITATKTVTPANPDLGTEEKTLYYLVVEIGKEKLVINVGLKTYEKIQQMSKGIVGDLLDDGKLNKSNKPK